MKNPSEYGVADAITGHAVVDHEAWISARKELLKKEKELTRLGDEVSAARRALPWEKVTKEYVFDAAEGKVSLSGLFGTKRQLIVHHLMFQPGHEAACIGCSHSADHADSARQHFEHADVSYVAISRASLADLQKYARRMGWTFRWVSSGATDFNQDYGVTFTPEQVESGDVGYNYGTAPYAFEELPGVSVFYRDEDGTVYHTYSTYARGLDILLGSHNYLDLVPKGRCGTATADDTGWLRYHDQYEDTPEEACCSCSKKEAIA